MGLWGVEMIRGWGGSGVSGREEGGGVSGLCRLGMGMGMGMGMGRRKGQRVEKKGFVLFLFLFRVDGSAEVCF